MSNTCAEPKRRPPPIHIPPLGLPRPVPGPNAFSNRSQSTTTQTNGGYSSQQHRDARLAASSMQHAHSATGTPLTSPLEMQQDGSYLPHSGSQTGRSRASAAMTTLSDFMDQARVSPRKSDHSSVPSRGGSTSRSRHSERSHHSAISGQAQMEAMYQGTKTTRAEIESRTERKLFKMTGQIPPTPTVDVADGEAIYIRTEDLRLRCRAANGEYKPDRDEIAKREDVSKSPKKKLFGVSFPTFSRTSTATPTPPMPSKAAQVLGTEARKPRRIEVRPIKPADPIETPTKAPRSDTTTSLPSKVLEASCVQRYHSSPRRNRAASRKSSGGRGAHSSTVHQNLNSSSDVVAPPTPPAKDTPPDSRPAPRASSPLRRAPPSEDLREEYGELVDRGMKLQFPTFALSPSPPKTAIPGVGGVSPAKFRPYTAEDYAKLIEGEALQWPYLEEGDAKQEGNHSAPLEGESRELLQPRHDRRSEDKDYTARVARQLSPMALYPRFYSPSSHPVGLFVEGESPSKNTNPKRLLFGLPTKAKDLHLREDSNTESNNGSIEMVFQGSVNDIDPGSPTARMVHESDPSPVTPHRRDQTELTTRAINEFRFDEHSTPRGKGYEGLLQPDQSMSKLTDMLDGVSPHRDLSGNFEPNCPSAVPSPLHKTSGPQGTPHLILPGPDSTHLTLWPPHTPKTMEDHFYMTNEHLDVVGKTTWDLLEISKQQQIAVLNTKHDQLVEIAAKHVEGIKSQIDFVSEKASDTSRHNHNTNLKLEELIKLMKSEVVDVLTAQSKKTTDLEVHIMELQKTVQGLQKIVEQKPSEPKTHPSISTAGSIHSPFPPAAHRPQPSLVGYYSSGAELGRDGQPALPRMQDGRNITSGHEAHVDVFSGYSNTYGQQWGPRSGYQGRSSKEDRPPLSGTNPYNYPNGGQFGNGYMGGYSSYNFSPSPSEQQFPYNQGPAK
ncbi:hypothetical protein P153DRAFT_388994 [Dothidotthia symphoricarpi CBS 119687]|uniref:Uncharacterized protein n=1 Tax=Dothidotthia symphoricarpi CBS 119687 TaxID=1392245 RepID=A0A6A6A300_9PLEO|nr:uncharacterized protein P153DRAFT_388994 [Dothidotthia symphoricarpi CBS 119687]KAF2126249.1 hypothetical protein P153DRAFT_388994 [Dothidotthia symphoricarpi CBS 119687]